MAAQATYFNAFSQRARHVMVGLFALVLSLGLSLEASAETLAEGVTVTRSLEVTEATGPAGPLYSFSSITPADVELTKLVNGSSSTTAQFGQTVSFSVTVENTNTDDAVFVQVIDQLPEGLTYVSSSGPGSYDPGSGFWLVNLAPGGSETLFITARVDAVGTLVNDAFIAEASRPDPDPSNDSGTATVNAIGADLAVSKRVVTLTPNEDDDDDDANALFLVFEVTVTNNGPDGVCNVILIDTLGAGMVFSTATPFVVPIGQVLTFNLGCLNVGEATSVLITVFSDGLTGNVASVSGDVADPNLSNNTAAAFATPRDDPDFVSGFGPGRVLERGGRRFSADLELEKEVAVDGDVATYTLTLKNNGPQTTNKVQVTDNLPECLTLSLATASQGSYSDATGIWDIGQAKAGVVYTLTLVTDASACTGPVTNTARITSSTLPDPDDFFNRFEDDFTPDDVATATFDAGEALGKASATTLLSNYPNPFNPETVIPFQLKEPVRVKLAVYDLLGRQVQVLASGVMESGRHEVTFNASALPSGVYLVRLEAGTTVATQRITLMK